MINSSQKGSICLRFPLTVMDSKDWVPLGAYRVPFQSLGSLIHCLPSSGMRRPLCQLATWEQTPGYFVCISSAGPLLALCVPDRSHGGAEAGRSSLCSHELWLLHRLLVCGWIPWGVAGNVRPRRPHWSFHGGRRAPNRCHRGGTSGKSAAIG